MKFRDDVATGEGGNFLKIVAGSPVRVILRGEVYEFYTHWTGQNSIECPGASCESCEKGAKRKFRFRVNAVTKGDDGKYQMKILEQGPAVYSQFRDLTKAGYELDREVLIITRTGTSINDTKYGVVPDPKNKWNPELEKSISTLPLHNLVTLEDGSTTGDDDQVPF